MKPCAVHGCTEPRAIAASGFVYSRCREHWRQSTIDWRTAHPERTLELGRRGRRRAVEKNPQHVAALGRAWRIANTERVKNAFDAWTAANPDRYADLLRKRNLRRKARKAGVVAVRVQSDVCGVCSGPLIAGLQWPHPLSTTVGHEPPLSRAPRGSTVIERPEHWSCNMHKGTRTDEEMAA